MDMGVDPADGVNVDARGIDAFAAKGVVGGGFDLGDQQRRTALGVPGDVQIDFRVVIPRHGGAPREEWPKPNGEKPPRRGLRMGEDCRAPTTRRQRRAYTANAESRLKAAEADNEGPPQWSVTPD